MTSDSFDRVTRRKRQTLVDAGLETVTPKADDGSSIGGQYSSASWTVVLAVTDSNGIVVNYTVSPK